MTELDLGEDIGDTSSVIGLGPAVERVLVALGTFEPDAHQRDGRSLGHLLDRGSTLR